MIRQARRRSRLLYYLLVPGLLSALVYARPAMALSSFFSVAYGRGGAALSDVTGGQNYNTQAGSGLLMSAGVLIPLVPVQTHRFELQCGIGYIFQQDGRSSESLLTWSRVPIEVVYFYRNSRELFRAGWGGTYHFANEISASGAYGSASGPVDNSAGFVVMAEKLFKYENDERNWGVGLKYVIMKYSARRFSNDIDANTVYATLTFPGQ
jgi:hypothetical protein